jgi:rubrerythrin
MNRSFVFCPDCAYRGYTDGDPAAALAEHLTKDCPFYRPDHALDSAAYAVTGMMSKIPERREDRMSDTMNRLSDRPSTSVWYCPSCANRYVPQNEAQSKRCPRCNAHGPGVIPPFSVKNMRCTHDRLNEDGYCRTCGEDCRGIHS